MTKAPDAYRYRYRDPLTGKPVWRRSCEPWNGQRPYETEALYTEDHALALVAAENEACAQKVESNRAHLNFEAMLNLLRDTPLPEPVVTAVSNLLDGIAAGIRARTPDDATAALKARDARIRNEARREVASYLKASFAGGDAIADAIENLITEGQSDGE